MKAWKYLWLPFLTFLTFDFELRMLSIFHSIVLNLNNESEACEPVFFIFDTIESYQALVVSDEVLVSFALPGTV